ncbi:MAG: electron transfer flavoprotein subunit beta [Candidatus Aminicenantes bacterium RBG_16_63_16]|nr:MAG: electron transfer flavoprotein subunit beta [Candidatus Aminicenantes bacterium RBG_16_63_16]
MEDKHINEPGAPKKPLLNRIVACVKQVPDTTQVKVDPVTGTLIREGVPFIINPFDIHAVEESLRLKDRYGAKVTAITMGPPNSVMTLQKCLALGADDAILVSDRVFSGADTWATSFVLSEAIKRLEKEYGRIDLVICGKQTIDGDTAQTGPGIATRLGLTQLTLVDNVINIDPTGRTITVSRKLEGRKEIVQGPLPALLTVVREINKPRYPTVQGRLTAEIAQIPVWSNGVLRLPLELIGLKGSPTNVKKIFAPQRAVGEILGDGENDPPGATRLLIQKLVERDLITF